MKKREKILAICGPTAIGKTGFAIRLAKRFDGEVISADSRQVYKGMDLGTGKVTEEEKEGIKHYLIDVADPKEHFSVFDFCRLARRALTEILEKGKLPIVCGGTGLYIKTFIEGHLLPKVPPNWQLREKLEKESLESLQEKLRQLDVDKWQRMNASDRSNPRRLVRALEIIETTGKPMPLIEKDPSNDPDVLQIGLEAPKDFLRERIKQRLMARLEQGMIKEIEDLHQKGVSWERLESFGLEYRWLALFLERKKTDEEMVNGLYLDIVSFAGRQMTWFKKDDKIHWFDISDQKWENKAEKLISSWF